MPLFTKALVRTPCRNMVHGLSTAGLGRPDYEKALAQHAAYVEALRGCGLAVTVLDGRRGLSRLGVHRGHRGAEREGGRRHPARRPQPPGRGARRGRWPWASSIPGWRRSSPPGTLEGGDVMRAGDRFFVGLSARTNEEGARQFAAILQRRGYEMVARPPARRPAPEDRDLLPGKQSPAGLRGIPGPPPALRLHDHPGAAGRELRRQLALGQRPRAGPRRLPADAGGHRGRRDTTTVPVDVSEFRKLDGGLSCLSLRF